MPVTVKASSLSFEAKVERGQLLIKTEAGFLPPAQAGVTIDYSGGGEGGGGVSGPIDSTALYDPAPAELTAGEKAQLAIDARRNLKTTLGTLLAGEDQDRDWLRIVNGANDRWPVEGGQGDVLLGAVGDVGDLLARLDVVVTDSSKSQVVLRDGAVAPLLTILTHDTTPCTTTVLNTAINPLAVAADQYKGCLVKIGSQYRRVLTHGAFSAGAVNQYALDRALAAAPAASASFSVEDRRYVFEVFPTSTVVSGTQRPVGYESVQGAIRLCLESGISVGAFGSFT